MKPINQYFSSKMSVCTNDTKKVWRTYFSVFFTHILARNTSIPKPFTVKLIKRLMIQIGRSKNIKGLIWSFSENTSGLKFLSRFGDEIYTIFEINDLSKLQYQWYSSLFPNQDGNRCVYAKLCKIFWIFLDLSLVKNKEDRNHIESNWFRD